MASRGYRPHRKLSVGASPPRESLPSKPPLQQAQARSERLWHVRVTPVLRASPKVRRNVGLRDQPKIQLAGNVRKGQRTAQGFSLNHLVSTYFTPERTFMPW